MAIYRNAGTYRAAGKIFACRAFEWRGIYPSLRRARDSLLIDISNHCARIAVLHAKEARFAVNKRNVKNKTNRNLVTYCCVAEICRSDSDSATIFTASIRIHWTSRYKEAMVHVPGISSEFKSPYNKPFIVADDEKRKDSFPLSRAFEGSFEITRQLLWARKVEGVSREAKNLENSRGERIRVWPNGERFPSAAMLFEFESVLRGDYSR